MSDDYNEIGLTELIARSGYILVVHEAKPFRTLHKIVRANGILEDITISELPITETKTESDNFITPRLHYVVDEVLYPKDPAVSIANVGDTIHVYRADLAYHYHLFKESQRGTNTLSIIDVYRDSPNDILDDRCIIFLRYNGGGKFEFTVDEAIETLATKASILNLIEKNQKKTDAPFF